MRIDIGKPESDGAYCGLVQRRVSRRISPVAAARLRPNAVTGVGLIVGLAAAASAAAGAPVAAAALLQAFGVLSCVDGEVARLRDGASELGDFLDTMTDRVVEVAAFAGTIWWLARRPELTDDALRAGVALFGAILLLVVSAEKYRSAFGRGYPKRRYEWLLSWVSAGSDARLLLLSIGLLVAAAGWERVLVFGLAALALVGYLNVGWRVAMVAREVAGAQR